MYVAHYNDTFYLITAINSLLIIHGTFHHTERAFQLHHLTS